MRVDNLERHEILEKIESFLSDGGFHQVATVNAEFILQAQKDEEFKNILNKSDLNVADTISIRYAFLRFGKWLKCRFAGADLMHEVLRIANDKKLAVFLAANKNGLSSYEEIKKFLSELYPEINFFGEDIDPGTSYKLSDRSCRLILCAFGAPRQEMFINSLKDDIIGVAMGVGGSFDFVTGKAKRAPKFIRIFGFEWLWRLIMEPRYRLKRILNAVVVFPVKILLK